MLKKWLILVVIGLVAAGCSASPSKQYVLGDQVLNESFDQADAWESFTIASTGADYHVGDGVYHTTTGSGGYVWGLNTVSHSDVVIEVTASQTSSFENNAYGVMCRADTSNNGDGYYFLVSGDGFYAIGSGSGENVNPIVDWTKSSAVHTGAATNAIRAVCIGDYLALYVNDQFVAEAHDSAYTSGYAGVATAVFQDGQTADIDFDNLKIWSATLKS